MTRAGRGAPQSAGIPPLLLARRILVRPVSDVRTELLGRLNLARDVTGSKPLKRHAALEKVAGDAGFDGHVGSTPARRSSIAARPWASSRWWEAHSESNIRVRPGACRPSP